MTQLLAWQKGITDFNSGRFWEAHHGWEQGWTGLSPPQKDYVQALIQSCAVFVHIDKGKPGPAHRLCTTALLKLERVEPFIAQILPRIEIEGLGLLLKNIRQELSSGECDKDKVLNRAQALRARLLV